MTRLHPWNAYRQVATQTASPGQLVLMLYDGAIRFLEQAQAGFDIEDPAACNQAINNNIIRAQQILDELTSSLNLSQGGELAVTLQSLYGYLHRRLQEANIRKETEGIVEAVKHISTLRHAWATMLNGQSMPQSSHSGSFTSLSETAAA